MITSTIYFLEGTEFTSYKIMLPAMTCQQHYYRTKFTFPFSFEVIVYATKNIKIPLCLSAPMQKSLTFSVTVMDAHKDVIFLF